MPVASLPLLGPLREWVPSPAFSFPFHFLGTEDNKVQGQWSHGIERACVCAGCSIVSDSTTPWTVAHQAPLSMGFSRQEYWSGLPLPSPGDLPYPGIEPGSPALQADSLPSEPPGEPRNSLDSSKWRMSCQPKHQLGAIKSAGENFYHAKAQKM